MWPFSKKESLADRMKRESEEAVKAIAEKWMIYNALPFKPDVSLTERIFGFMEPAVDGLLQQRPVLATAPAEVIILIVANGISSTGTHSALEVQDALGIPRDDR